MVAARKIEWPRQRRLVPAHAPARALHHAQRHRIRARREGVIGELALARQNFGPGIEERTRLDRNPRPRTIDGAIGLSSVDLLGFDRRYVDYRCSEHCKAQPCQKDFNAHDAPRPKSFSAYTTVAYTTAMDPRSHHSVARCVKFPTIRSST